MVVMKTEKQNNRKRNPGRRAAALCLVLLCIFTLCGFRTADGAAAGGGHIKAAMYFGHTWQINFWSGEHADADRDFGQIAEDGFNTVIFVVPWRAFQPSLQAGMNQNMLTRLDYLMERAEAAGGSRCFALRNAWKN